MASGESLTAVNVFDVYWVGEGGLRLYVRIAP